MVSISQEPLRIASLVAFPSPTNPRLLLSVIHFFQTSEAIHAELPSLLAGGKPQAAASNDIGSHDYTRPARAVIFGRGYEMAEIDGFRKAAARHSSLPIAWVISDPAKIQSNGPPPPPGYANTVTDLVKSKLNEWKASGAGENAVLLY